MSTGATPRQPSRGPSALAIVVPLVALVGVVFALTYLNESVPPDPLAEVKGGGPRPDAKSAEPPLRFFTSLRRYDPPATDAPGYRGLPLLAPSAVSPPPDPLTGDAFGFRLQDRAFQGFYEPGETVRRTQFWFENRNPAAVALQLQGVSCLSCSGASLAPIPPETTKSLLQNAALSALPVGAFNAFTLGAVEPASALVRLNWQRAAFADDPHARFVVPAAPAAPDKWVASQWGILELNFKVRANGKVPLEAQFVSRVDGTTQQGRTRSPCSSRCRRPRKRRAPLSRSANWTRSRARRSSRSSCSPTPVAPAPSSATSPRPRARCSCPTAPPIRASSSRSPTSYG